MSSSVQRRWCRGVAGECFRRAAYTIVLADCLWQPLNSNVERQLSHRSMAGLGRPAPVGCAISPPQR